MPFNGDNIVEMLRDLGWTKAVFTVFFFMAHGYIWSLYKGRLNDRQKEIDRLAADNREYRERLLKLMDDGFSYSEASSRKSKKK